MTKYLLENGCIRVYKVIMFLTLLLLFSIPHLSLNYLFSYGALVNQILYSAVLFLFALILISSLSNSNTSLTFFDILILCFALLNLLNSDSWFNPNETAWVILTSILCYFIIRCGFEKIEEGLCFKHLTYCILIAVLIQITYVLLQFAGVLLNPNHLFNVGGSFGHPGYTIGVLSLGLLIVISNHNFSELDKYLQLAIVISLVITTILSVTLATRASIIVSGISLFVLINQYYPTFKIILNKYKIVFIIFVFSIGFALFFLKPNSLKGRYFIWKNAVHLIAQNPLIGFGSGKFTNTYNAYQITYFRSGFGNEEEKRLADFVILAYNDFLETGVELGLFGMALLLAIFVGYPLYSIRKQGSWGSLFPFIGIFICMSTWGILHEQIYSNLLFTFLAFWKGRYYEGC